MKTTVYTSTALDRMKRGIADANSSAFAAWLTTELPELGGPDAMTSLVDEAEAEGAALIGAVPCPDGIHGWEHSQTGEIHDFSGGPCPACGAAV